MNVDKFSTNRYKFHPLTLPFNSDVRIMKPHVLDWLKVSLLPNLGPIKLAKLINRFGSPKGILRRYCSLKENADLETRALEIHSEISSLGAFILSSDCPDYPPLLAEIPDHPPIIYVKGTLPKNLDRAIAVVGTRKCTEDGAALASKVAEQIALLNCPLISGLALGIDAAAHRASMAHKSPTVAVLAHGLDRIHPRIHTKLAQRLLDNGGALISEHPPRTEVLPWMFAARNRILVGISTATVLVQSPIKGGSMISARLALNYNRDTYAVAPPKNDTHSTLWAGNLELIISTEAQKIHNMEIWAKRLYAHNSSLRDAVTLSIANDVQSDSGDPTSKDYPQSSPQIPEPCKSIYSEITHNSVETPARLAQTLRVSVRIIRTRLFVLEILGWVRRVPGDRYILK